MSFPRQMIRFKQQVKRYSMVDWILSDAWRRQGETSGGEGTPIYYLCSHKLPGFIPAFEHLFISWNKESMLEIKHNN